MNQVILAGAYLGVAEGIVLAMKAGLDPEQRRPGAVRRRRAQLGPREPQRADDRQRLPARVQDVAPPQGPRHRAGRWPARSAPSLPVSAIASADRDRARRPGPRRRGHVQRRAGRSAASPASRAERRARLRRGDRPAATPTAAAARPSRPVVPRPEPLAVVHRARRPRAAAAAPVSASDVSAYLPSRIATIRPNVPSRDQVHRDVRERRRDHGVERVGLARCGGRRSARSRPPRCPSGA